MGDWNFVEEAIDRSPMHEDDNRIKDAFRVLKHKYNLIDGWRMNNDEDIGFTFSARDTNSLSRIDRIYAAKNAYLYTVDWKIQATGKISDHEMVTADILKKGLPYIGNGMKTFPIDILQYQPFVKESAIEIYIQQKAMVRNEAGSQTIWNNLQASVMELANKHRKQRLKDLDKKYNSQKNELANRLRALNEQTINNVEQKNRKIKEAMDKVNKTRKERLEAMGLRTKARFELNTESMTRYWFRTKGELPGMKHKRSPQATPGPETILGLFNKDGVLVTETRAMKDIASKYHEELQSEQKWNGEREAATNTLLNDVKVKLSEDEQDLLCGEISQQEVRARLNESENGKSPGITGIQYEFWKFWEKKRIEFSSQKREATNDYERAIQNINPPAMMAI
ncbi:hypothetical protein BD310DRAFT_910964, partial [Dichomitus squalens]